MGNLKNVCAYCRVSTNNKDQENSFENQKNYFERKLCEDNGYNLIDIYTDKGLSGTDFRRRDGFNKMLYDAGIDMIEASARSGEIRNKYITPTYVLTDRKPKFNLIFVKNSSRFARNIEVSMILNRLKDKGVYVYFEDLQKSTEKDDDNIMLNFMFSLDQRESIDKSNKVRFGARESAEKGRIRVGGELYGYDFNKVENTLTKIPKEAEIIKLIYKLRLEGKGCRQISGILRKMNIKTRRGVYFRDNVIVRILKNPIYTGKVVRNKFDCSRLFGENKKKLKDRSEWIVKESERVDKIIEDDVFYKVQQLINKNTAKGFGLNKGSSKYASKIKCGMCGKNYSFNKVVSQKKYGKYERLFYNCSLKKSMGTNYCTNKNHSIEEFDNIINKYCSNGYYKKYSNKLYKEAQKEFDKRKEFIMKSSVDSEEVNIIKEDIRINEEKLEILLDQFLSENSDSVKNIFNRKKQELGCKIDALKEELSYYNINEKEKLQKIDNINKMLAYLKDEYKNIPSKIPEEEFIKKYLVYFIVDMDKIEILTSIEVTYNSLIEQLNEI